MVKKVSVVNWKFDAARWADALRDVDAETLEAARDLSGLTVAGWRHWLRGTTASSYQHPGMQNFINVCNLLDLNPSDFFTTDEKRIDPRECRHTEHSEMMYQVAPERGSEWDVKQVTVRCCLECGYRWTHRITHIKHMKGSK